MHRRIPVAALPWCNHRSKDFDKHDGVKGNSSHPVPIRLFFLHGERHKESDQRLFKKPEKIPKDLTWWSTSGNV
jgi:hypothetical protein